MMTISEKEERIEEFHRTAKGILELLQTGEILTGYQEHTLNRYDS
ncbi:hypothetical protein [Nitrospira sp. Nam74]